MENKNIKDIFIICILFTLAIFGVIAISIRIITPQKQTKESLFLSKIIHKSEFDDDDFYVFQGNPQNNYIIFNNLLWRIVRINSSGTITIILDDAINKMPLMIDNNYYMKKYLETMLLPELDTEKITYTKVCADTIDNLDNIECNNIEDALITLPDLTTFIESFQNDSSYITKKNQSYWLNNLKNETLAWHINSNKLSTISTDEILNIKPMITLKNDILYESGDGTKNNPYIISPNKVSIGSKVKLANDIYTIYSTKDDIKMCSNNPIKDYNYINIKSLMNYLNSYKNSLSYQELLKEYEWQIIDIKNGNVTYNTNNNLIGTLNLFDLKINDSLTNYYLLLNIENHIIINDNNLIYGTKNSKHNIKPCIVIDKESFKNFKLVDNYYTMEI